MVAVLYCRGEGLVLDAWMSRYFATHLLTVTTRTKIHSLRSGTRPPGGAHDQDRPHRLLSS